MDYFSDIKLRIVDYDLIDDDSRKYLKEITYSSLKNELSKLKIEEINHEKAYEIGLMFIQMCDIMMSEQIEKESNEDTNN